MAVSDTLIKMLDDRNRQAISEALQDMEQATARLVGQAQNLGSVIDGAGAAVRDTHAEDIALRARLGEITRALATAQTNVDDASAIVKKVDNWAHDFDNVVQGIRPGLADLTRNLKDLDGTVMAWRELVDRLARNMNDFERDPTHTLLGEPRVGYRPK